MPPQAVLPQDVISIAPGVTVRHRLYPEHDAGAFHRAKLKKRMKM